MRGQPRREDEPSGWAKAHSHVSGAAHCIRAAVVKTSPCEAPVNCRCANAERHYGMIAHAHRNALRGKKLQPRRTQEFELCPRGPEPGGWAAFTSYPPTGTPQYA